MPWRPVSRGAWAIPIQIAAIGLGVSPCVAQEAAVRPYSLPGTEVHRVPSAAVGDTFLVAVALPAGFGAESRGLPLVVMTDADLAFAATAQIARLMQFRSEVPDFVLVGVGYGDTRTALRRRRRDLTPSVPPDTDVCSDAPGCGGADRFLRFIEEELVAFVEARYHTSADRTLVGASLGGLFGAFVLLGGSDAFRRYVLGSPTVSWDGRRLVDRAASGAADTARPPPAVFIGVGGAEGAAIADARALERAVIAARPDASFVRLDVFEGERHMSVQPMVVARGLRWVFQVVPPEQDGAP